MLPAYAGMIPSFTRITRTISSAPRVCGDDPIPTRFTFSLSRVLPAYAGMIPSRRCQ